VNKKIKKTILLLALSLVWLLTISLDQAPLQAQEETFSVTFSQLGYSDLRLRGLYGSASLWIPFPSDKPVTGPLLLNLTYIGSPLLNEDNAIVTVLANGVEVTSFRPVGNGREVTVPITFPMPPNAESGITLGFAAHLRLTDEACEDSFNVGQWLIVRNSSRLTTNLAAIFPAPELSDLPQALVVQGSDTPPPILYVLPEDADETTLTTAVQVASRLGEGITPAHLPLRVKTAVTLTDADKRNSNLVVIGLLENNPLIEELIPQMPAPPDSGGFVSRDNVSVPDSDGVLQIFPSPWQESRNILLVSANATEGLAMAGSAFADQTTYQSLSESYQFINRLVVRPERALPLPWTTAQTSFAQLGEPTRELTGVGIIDTYYFFQLPPGAMLDNTAQLVLHLAFSPALSNERAYAEVYINDIYIGAVQAADARGNAWVALDLPEQALSELARTTRGRELAVKLSVANLLPVNNCDPINAESSWTKIYDDSYFQTNFDSVALPDLFFFPYPFVHTSVTPPTSLVLSARPTAEDLQMALSLAAVMGNQAITDLTLDVIKAETVTPEAYVGQQLALIGDLSSHPLLPEFAADVEIKVPTEVYQIFNDPRVGLYQTQASPWDEEMIALGVYGKGQAGARAAYSAFYKQGRLTDESGSLALIGPDQTAQVIYREAGLPQPQVFQPNIVVSEISSQPAPATEAVVAEETAVPTPDSSATETGSTAGGLSSTERTILVITAFIVVLVAATALMRIAWRIRP
jgi:cellulose synthase operon protein B